MRGVERGQFTVFNQADVVLDCGRKRENPQKQAENTQQQERLKTASHLQPEDENSKTSPGRPGVHWGSGL